MADPDFTDKIVWWLYDTYEVTPDTALAMVAGLQIGVALVTKYSAYAQTAHQELGEDCRRRLAVSPIEFEAMAVASGDERTSPEKMADEMVEACPLPT